jgi:hypothetical protein
VTMTGAMIQCANANFDECGQLAFRIAEVSGVESTQREVLLWFRLKSLTLFPVILFNASDIFRNLKYA